MNTIIYNLSSRSVCILMDDMLEEEHQYEMRVRQSVVPGVKEITLTCYARIRADSARNL